MSRAHSACLSIGSTDSPMTLTPRRANSGSIRAMYPSSVVQTGVKSFGCEKSTAQESPIHSWKRIRPSVVSASKSGAVSPSCRVMSSSFVAVRATLRRPCNAPVTDSATRLERALDVALRVTVDERPPLVAALLAPRERELELHLPVLEVHARRDERLSLLAHLPVQRCDLAAQIGRASCRESGAS